VGPNPSFTAAYCLVHIEKALLQLFEEIERARVGEGKHQAYRAMLHRLKDLYKVA
jgi:hypothetical protein